MSKAVKPFLKWAGGKTQLIPTIENVLPKGLISEPFTYVEPFVGSGAVLFWILNNFPKLEKAVINDINLELTDTYKTIAANPAELIEVLELLQNEFHFLEADAEKKKEYYYEKRSLFNSRKSSVIEQSGLFIFLNRTCSMACIVSIVRMNTTCQWAVTKSQRFVIKKIFWL